MNTATVQGVMACMILTACFVGADEPPLTTVVFRVLDEAGAPITNAWVHGTGYWRPAKSEGVTDANGYFSYEDRVFGDIGCRVGKIGYYDTHGEAWSGPRKLGDHPTNALVVVLRKVINPVSMTYRRVKAHLPRLSVPVAFDLDVGDWVNPDGRGLRQDVWVRSQKRMANKQDFELAVTLGFTNNLDGIQEFYAPSQYGIPLASDLMPPQQAPPNGYTGRLEVSKQMIPGRPYSETWRKDRNYIFRIRTLTNEVGDVVEANHGWIRGDFVIGPDEGKTTLIMFNYYFNPDTHSRSLEPKEAE